MPKQTLQKNFELMLHVFKRHVWLFVAVIVAGLSAIAVLWPASVTFSYQGKTCVYQPMVLPSALKTVGTKQYRVEPAYPFKVGNIAVASGGMCVVALTTPLPGKHTVLLSPIDWPVLGKAVNVEVRQAPVAHAAQTNQPIPIGRPLKLSLDEPDTTFTYKVTVLSKTSVCRTVRQTVSCDLQPLGLGQGQKYQLKVARYFGSKLVENVLDREITTLAAASVRDASIKPHQTVYDKPKSIQLTFDKAIKTIDVKLVRLDVGTKVELKTEVAGLNTQVNVSWQEDLARGANYELQVTGARAVDGSTLDAPYTVSFKMSGGPVVMAINIGKIKVASSTRVVIDFDQPLLTGQDIRSLVTATGGAVVTGAQGNQVYVSLAGVPICSDFRITVGDNIKSVYGISGGSAWSYSSRTTCQRVVTIGYSAQGRPINAYYFGSGAQTVLFTGAIHGNELSTRSLMLAWIDELEANARSVPAGKTVVVIPSLNPDGVASGGRTNGHNVDLNRNFGTSDWKTDVATISNAPFPGGGGVAAMSEPETRAIASFVAQLQPFVVLSYHSTASIVAANGYGNSVQLAGAYARLSGYGNASGGGETFEYAISGTADDYYGEKLGVASILIELGSNTNSQFEKNKTAMWSIVTS